MSLEHVTAFTAAMQRKDLEAMLSHMAGDVVVLNTPLVAERWTVWTIGSSTVPGSLRR
jgi:limonene-1,2-epoxide hydrolase